MDDRAEIPYVSKKRRLQESAAASDADPSSSSERPAASNTEVLSENGPIAPAETLSANGPSTRERILERIRAKLSDKNYVPEPISFHLAPTVGDPLRRLADNKRSLVLTSLPEMSQSRCGRGVTERERAEAELLTKNKLLARTAGREWRQKSVKEEHIRKVGLESYQKRQRPSGPSRGGEIKSETAKGEAPQSF